MKPSSRKRARTPGMSMPHVEDRGAADAIRELQNGLAFVASQIPVIGREDDPRTKDITPELQAQLEAQGRQFSGVQGGLDALREQMRLGKAIGVLNAQGTVIPAYSAVEIAGISSSGVVKVQRPTADSLQPGLVLFTNAAHIPTGSVGWAWSGFDLPVDVECSDSVATGDTLGTVTDSYELSTANFGFVAQGWRDDYVRVRPFRGPDVYIMAFIDESSPYYSASDPPEELALFQSHYAALESLSKKVISILDPNNYAAVTSLYPPSIDPADYPLAQFHGIYRPPSLAEIQAVFTADYDNQGEIALYIDTSGSMTRADIEPAIDDFIAWLASTGAPGVLQNEYTKADEQYLLWPVLHRTA